MPFVTVPTATTGAIITAAYGNILRDNLAYHQGLLDGTGSDIVKFPTTVRFVNDNNFSAEISGGNPIIRFDSSGSDFLLYDRTNNILQFYVASALKFQVDSGGKVTGTGFYDSGTVTVAGGTTSPTFSHGFAVRPRLIGGWWATAASSDLDDGSSTFVRRLASQVPGTFGETEPYLSDATATTIRGGNPTGGTVYMRVFAIK